MNYDADDSERASPDKGHPTPTSNTTYLQPRTRRPPGLISGLANRLKLEDKRNLDTPDNRSHGEKLASAWAWPAEGSQQPPLSRVSRASLHAVGDFGMSVSGKPPSQPSSKMVSQQEKLPTGTDRPYVPYVYTPLPNGKFTRVIELLPGKGKEIDILLWTRQLVRGGNLETQYTALSYEWGLPEISVPISGGEEEATIDITLLEHVNCRGKSIQVTKSLFDVLQHLRIETESRILWIDGICINQQNNNEKGVQVSMMKEVYAFANEVILWLGPEDDNTMAAFSLISELSEAWKIISSGKSGSWVADVTQSKRYAHLTDKTRYGKAWLGLRDLYSRRYFTRIWIVQEILIPEQSTVTCGSQKCTWDDFRSSFNLVLFSQLLGCILPEAESRDVFEPLIAISQLNDSAISDTENAFLRRLDQLLGNFLSHGVTNPRDRVFGMLGIMETSCYGFTLPPLITNYSKSVQEVYQEAAEWCIDAYKDLFVLDMISSSWRNNLKDLPSWVPDLTTGRRRCALYPPAPTPTFYPRFSRQYTPPQITGNMMATKGLIVDEIISLGPPLTESNIPTTLTGTFWNYCLDTALTPAGCTKVESICRNFLPRNLSVRYGAEGHDVKANKTEDPADAEDFAHFAATAWLSSLGLPQRLTGQERDIKNIATHVTHSDLAQYFPDDVKANISIPALRAKHPRIEFLYHCLTKGDGKKFVRQVSKNKLLTEKNFGRQLFKTENGYLGLGPPAPHGEIRNGELFMKKGAGLRIHDVVSILAGSGSVFVLRADENTEKGKTYRIVGDAYVYRLSEGLCFEGKVTPTMETIHII